MLVKGCSPIPAAKGDRLQGVDRFGNKIHVSHDSAKQDKSHVKITGKDDLFEVSTEWQNIVKFRGLGFSNVSGKKSKPVQIAFKDGQKVIITTGGL